jgi:hypothetical protein
VARVAIVASVSVIEELLGEVVALAGHQPRFLGNGPAGEDELARVSASVLMLDACLDSALRDAWARAAERIALIYFAAGINASELHDFARAHHAAHLSLPAGPKQMGEVLNAVVAQAHSRELMAQATLAKAVNKLLRLETRVLLHEAREHREALHDAVVGYAGALRAGGADREAAIDLVNEVVARPDGRADAVAVLPTGRELASWVDQAYHVA